MVERNILIFTSLLLILFRAVTSIQDVELLTDPPFAIAGQRIALICLRKLEDKDVYTVKWFRGTHEFFRYTPKEDDKLKSFIIPGIQVSMLDSNGTQVMLRNMNHEISGNFTCEVTAENKFNTYKVTKIINVITPPRSDPVLKADKDKYRPGEVLIANCSSGPAKPAPILTVLVNEKPLRSVETSLLPAPGGLYISSVNVKVKVTSGLFVGGRLRIECSSVVGEPYERMSRLDFFTPDTDPRPERITLNSGASRCFQHLFLLFLLLFLPAAICQDYDQLSEGLFSDTFQYYDDDSENNAIISAIGG